MKVHELDEAYQVSKEEVRAALEAAELSTHHSSKLDDDELQRFEAALLQAEKEASASHGPPLVSPFKPGLFKNKQSEQEAIELLAGREVAWARREY